MRGKRAKQLRKLAKLPVWPDHPEHDEQHDWRLRKKLYKTRANAAIHRIMLSIAKQCRYEDSKEARCGKEHI